MEPKVVVVQDVPAPRKDEAHRRGFLDYLRVELREMFVQKLPPPVQLLSNNSTDGIRNFCRVPLQFEMFIFYSMMWMLSIFTLANYHTWLLVKNLTTNEHLNASKYSYLRDEYDDFSNPFDSGNVWTNIWDGLFPSHRPYYSRQEVLGDGSATVAGDVNEMESAHESARLL